MTQRRAQRGTSKQLTSGSPLRFLRPPYSISVQLGLVSWKTMKVTVIQEQRGGGRWTGTRTVDLDAEGRLPAEVHTEIYRVVEDFIAAEWLERISRSF